jgi:hypothetical protein
LLDTPCLAHLLRLNSFRRDDDRCLRARSLDEPVYPALQAKAVHQNEPRRAELFGVGGFWLIYMSVAIRADEFFNLDPLGADIAGEIGENRKGRDDRQLFGGLRLSLPCARRARARNG